MKEEFSFLSSNGENSIHGVRWIPDGEVKCIVQISHGMCEYIERYSHFAEFLNSKGILVTGNDHLGHGHSVKNEADLGYFAQKDASKCTVDDVHAVTILTKKLYPDVPYILLGHSMGSYITSNYIERFGEELDGAILVGTGYEPPVVCMAGRTLCWIIARIRGERHRSRLINKGMFGKYNSRIKNSKTSFDWICSDEKVIEKYVADPHCNFTFTVNGNRALIDFAYYETRPSHLDAIPGKLPVYLAAGDCDPVGSYGKGLYKIERLFKKHGVEDVSTKLYPGMRHEILNETGREQVYEDIYGWICTRVNLKKE